MSAPVIYSGNDHTPAFESAYDFVWPTMYPGKLIKRYQRFKADIILENGRIITAHCPNSGRMEGCSEPERLVYVSKSNNPRRKYLYTWEMIQMPTSLVIVNTLLANCLIKEAILGGKVPLLTKYDKLSSEVPYGQNSRIDILLENSEERCLVEIKSCTLARDRTAFFPDAPTSRGRKHLIELKKSLNEKTRCVMFYLVQRMDTDSFSPACFIDPEYCREFMDAVSKGVEVIVYDVSIDRYGVSLNKELDFF